MADSPWEDEMERMLQEAKAALVEIVNHHHICPRCFCEALITLINVGIADNEIVHQEGMIVEVEVETGKPN